MLRQGKRKISECVHCGEIKPISDDHIPPKCLFPKPYPLNMITVPSCDNCNQGASKDDEYLRLIFTAREDVENNSSVQKILPLVRKSLNRKEYPGLRMNFIKSTTLVDGISKAGLYIGKIPLHGVDSLRLNRVLKRIINGIIYDVYHYRIPNNYARVWWNINSLKLNQEELLCLLNIVDKLSIVDFKQIGTDIFKYKLLRADDDDFSIAGTFTFYERIWFLFITLDKNAIHPINIIR